MIPAGECSKCGLEHTRCHAHKSWPEGVKPCMAQPIRGGSVCWLHGGRAPQVRAKAAERVAEREALAQAQQQFARRRPSEILLDALHKADAMAQQAAAEDWPDAAAWQAKAEQLAQVALNKDLESNEARIVEEQGVMLADTVRRILNALGLTREQWEQVPVVVPRELRAADVPESPSLTAAVRALGDRADAWLTERQVAMVVQAWRRVMVHLALDEETQEDAARVFLSELRVLDAEEQPAGVVADAEPVG